MEISATISLEEDNVLIKRLLERGNQVEELMIKIIKNYKSFQRIQ